MDEKTVSNITSISVEGRTSINAALSFAADPAQKARCLAQLGPENHPSECAAGGKHRFAEELGVPAVLAVVIDALCWLRQADNDISARDQAIALIAAIPVAADLTAVPRSFAYWLLHDAQWGIAQYCPAGPLEGVLPRIEALHAQELTGKKMSEQAWKTLEQNARAEIEAAAASDEDQQYLASLLECLTAPLHSMDSEQMGKLFGGAVYFAGERSKARYWSRSEELQLDALYDAFRAGFAPAPGPRPSAEHEAELALWINREQALDAAWEQHMRQQQAVLLTRWETWGTGRLRCMRRSTLPPSR
ncbi:hypothetical protein [Collimonas pratensis]|uniref:Uncharacterized protein n=1 Tax=Collimonas pratensis TaxID=279113 RepID=A0ABM5Z3F9_9BURK|nr:hypothetical protein [Collimonas pratensis]AMP13271.1 hypothetical protein CPter291_0993 [Collimonas pratensis]